FQGPNINMSEARVTTVITIPRVRRFLFIRGPESRVASTRDTRRLYLEFIVEDLVRRKRSACCQVEMLCNRRPSTLRLFLLFRSILKAGNSSARDFDADGGVIRNLQRHGALIFAQTNDLPVKSAIRHNFIARLQRIEHVINGALPLTLRYDDQKV